ncbi:MAG: thermonuclease family protein [Candidatus Omnitrophica bacterium]|nr:thermonuclease family protein [Candidatus Omnitrophota bacterium]MCB9720968.1 thermonuclease family protein [Candidatus Omnitrophota bacterium]
MKARMSNHPMTRPLKWQGKSGGIIRLVGISALLITLVRPVAAATYVLQDVVDYRTIVVLVPSGEEETVRLTGIEAARPDLQAKAEAYLRTILRGHDELKLEFDRQQRDGSGRLLAYVWAVHRRDARWLAVNRVSMHFDRDGLTEYWGADKDDGLQYRCLNAELIRSGFARAAVIPPNVLYQKQLLSMTREAQERHRKEAEANRTSDVPRDLEECYRALKSKLRQPELVAFMNTAEEDLDRYDAGLGNWLRDRWGLSQDSELHQYFQGLGIADPLDISRIILTSFHRYLNGRDIRLDEQLQACLKKDVNLHTGD